MNTYLVFFYDHENKQHTLKTNIAVFCTIISRSFCVGNQLPSYFMAHKFFFGNDIRFHVVTLPCQCVKIICNDILCNVVTTGNDIKSDVVILPCLCVKIICNDVRFYVVTLPCLCVKIICNDVKSYVVTLEMTPQVTT